MIGQLTLNFLENKGQRDNSMGIAKIELIESLNKLIAMETEVSAVLYIIPHGSTAGNQPYR